MHINVETFLMNVSFQGNRLAGLTMGIQNINLHRRIIIRPYYLFFSEKMSHFMPQSNHIKISVEDSSTQKKIIQEIFQASDHSFTANKQQRPERILRLNRAVAC